MADQLESGEAEYRASCAVCHAADGKGNGVYSGYLSIEPPDISLLSQMNGGEFPSEWVSQVIDGRELETLHGSQKMPIWGDKFLVDSIRSDEFGSYVDAERIVKDRINALVEYIKSLQVE